MNRIIAAVYAIFRKNRFVFFVFLLGTFLGLLYLAFQIRLEEDITKIMPNGSNNEKLGSFLRDSKFADKLIVTVSLADTIASDPEELIAYASKLTDTLNTVTYNSYITSVNAKVDDTLLVDIYGIMYEHLPVFLTEKDYEKIDSLIRDSVFEATFKSNYATLLSPASIFLKKFIIKDPVGITGVALGKLQSLQPDDNFELYEGYIITKDRKKLLLFITPSNPPNETSQNRILLTALDAILASLSDDGGQKIKAEYFGAMPIAVGNARQIQRDITLTLFIALVCIVLVLWWYFKNILLPFIILLPVIFGSVFSLAVIYLLQGYISVIALGAGAVVLGIAIDYSLHIFTHYKHTNSIDTVIKDLATPMMIGCITTVGAFLSLLFVKSELLHDFGLFCGLSLIGSVLFSLFFLLQFMNRPTGHIGEEERVPGLIDKISLLRPERNRWFAAIIVVLTLIFLYTSQFAGFESDMKKINYITPAMQEAERNLNKINPNASESVYLIFNGNDLNDALENNEKALPILNSLRERKLIDQYTGVTDLLVSDDLQNERIEKWNTYWQKGKKDALREKLEKNASKSGFKEGTFLGFEQWMDRDFQPISVSEVSTIKNGLLQDYIIEKGGKTSLLAMIKLPIGYKKEAYALLSQSPGLDIIDKSNLTTGFIEIIHDDFNLILALCSGLVFIILLISYGRIELTAITFIPMAISWIWIVGIMGLLDIKFNIVNIIIATFIFGLGDDYSIFITDGLLQEYKTGKKNLASYKASIFLSAITTMIGVGVLIMAGHPALKSIALISIIGIISVVLISYTLIPLLFDLLIRNRTSKGFPPYTLTGLFATFAIYFFLIFGGSLLLFFRLILLIAPVRKKYTQDRFAYALYVFAKSTFFLSGRYIKVKMLNDPKENFRIPSVIISNHQSMMDILLVLTLSPRLILVTNDWVWHSPLIGNIAKAAGFQTTSNGLETAFESLQKNINEGYSVVIFPEGTRSLHGQIQRFHKGAFFLAEKLTIDIVPLIIHGSADSMPKNDLSLIQCGDITMKVLPRIKPQNPEYGNDYQTKTKAISKYFKAEYALLKAVSENPVYFHSKLKPNYLYKNPVTEWYVEFKLKIENHYTTFIDLLPIDGYIVDVGCGYGVLSYLLNLHSPGRNILGIDYDDDKIEVAKNGYLKNADVNFISGDVLSIDLPMADAFVIIDVLHYMEESSQQKLINACTAKLKPGGIILIRDSDSSRNSPHSLVKFAEFVSTNVLGFNKSVNQTLHFISSGKLMDMVDLRYFNIQKMQVDAQNSNTVYCITHKDNS